MMSSSLRPWVRGLALLGLLVASCIVGATPPRVTPSRSLGVEGWAAPLQSPADRRPLGVEFASPRGETGSDVDIVLVFNKSMRRLEFDASQAPLPVSLTPSISGHWEWIGARVLHFVPAAWIVPRATEFKVVVPAGTRAVDGSQLAQPYELAFQTPRPSVESVEIENKPNGVITLHLDQETSVDEVQHATRLTLAAGGKAVDIPFKTQEASGGKGFELVALQPLPRDVDVAVSVDGRLRCTEGPRTLGETWHGSVHTYGPLKIHGECNVNDADEDEPAERSKSSDGICSWGAISLKFSSPVFAKDVMRAVSIVPSVELESLDGSDGEPTQEVTLSADFAPGGQYAVRVSPGIGRRNGPRGLRDAYGEALLLPWSQSFRFRPESDELQIPRAWIAASGSIIDTKPPAAVDAFATKLSQIGVTTAPLSLPEYVLLSNTDAATALRSIAGSKHWMVPLPPGKVDKTRIALDGLFGEPGHESGGAIIALDEKGKQLARWMAHVTDLGLTTVSTPYDRLAWVTHLSNGAPIAGVTVDFMQGATGATSSTGLTDSDGFFFDSTSEPRAWPVSVSARQQDAWTYVHSDYTPYLPDMGTASMFTNQGIYRPGETVRIKGIVRAFGRAGIEIPKQRAVSVSIDSYDRPAEASLSAQLDDYGAYSTSWIIPASAKVGFRFIKSCTTLWEKPVCSHTRIRVAEFRPPEFLVDASAEREEYIRGDTVRCNAQARLLLGMPLRDARIEWESSSYSAFVQPPSDERYFWSGAGGSLNRPERDVHKATAKLDRAGTDVMRHKLSLGETGDPAVRWTCQAGVTERSRQQEFGLASVLVHPAEFYLGIKASSGAGAGFARPGTPITVHVIAAEPDGTHRASVAVRLTFRRVTGNGALGDTLAKCDMQTEQTKQTKRCSFVPDQPGLYKVIADAADPRGNRVQAELPVESYIPKPEPVTSPVERRASEVGQKRDREANLDKTAYRVGDTAHLELVSPFDKSEALVTVTREGILARRHVSLMGASATVDLPIVDAFVPNALISVSFVSGRTSPPAQFDDEGAPAAQHLETELHVEPAGHHLNVTMVPSVNKARPGQNLNVDLTVTDSLKRPERCQLTVFATDESILALTNYPTPDPFEAFFEERGNGPAVLDSRQFLLDRASLRGGYHQTRAPKMRSGSTTIGDNTNSIRQDMRTAVYFNPDVRTDALGQAHVSFRLPDSLSSFRVMAVAVGKDRFGSAATSVTTSKSLMLRPALPRILRVGDEAEVAVLVTSNLARPTRATVNLAAEGLQLKGDSSQSVDVAAGATAEVRFPVRTMSVGRARLRFSTAASGGERDAVELPLEVKAPNVLRTVALYGETTSAAGERLGNLRGIRPDVGGLSVSLASSALVGLDADIQSLAEYPFGCTEQLASQLLPLVPLADLAQSTGVPPTRNRDNSIRRILSEIMARQRSDGGFSYWPGSAHSDPWISIQALTALFEAKRHGFDVAGPVLEKATQYARKTIAKRGASVKESALGVYALDVLVAIEKPSAADVSALHDAFEQRARLPLFARALLLHALARAHGDPEAAAMTAREIEQSIRVDGPIAVSVTSSPEFSELLDSDVRTTAFVLRALLAYDPHHPLASQLARGLLSARNGPKGSFRTTQEAGWALIALDEYRRAREPSSEPFDARVFLGTTLLAESQLSGTELRASRFFVPSSRLGSSSGDVLAFEVRGKGTLFYQARLTYSLPNLPTEPLENGFIVHRTLRVDPPESSHDAASATLYQLRETPDSIPVGSRVAVDVTVGTMLPRDQVVIECPVPAGLEITDPGHATSAALGPDAEQAHVVWLGRPTHGHSHQAHENWLVPSHIEARDDRMLFFFDHLEVGLYRAHFLTRATTIGTFVTPPAEASEMYAPEVSGRSRADRVRVTP